MKPSIVRERSYCFAVEIVKFCRGRENGTIRPVLSQLLRSATSVAANIEEAAAAQSRSDFASKMAIASKEAREANFWLRLLRDSECCAATVTAELINESEQLKRMLTAIVKTTKETPVINSNSKLKTQNSKLP